MYKDVTLKIFGADPDDMRWSIRLYGSADDDPMEAVDAIKRLSQELAARQASGQKSE